MPPTMTIAVFVFGAILLLIALVSGKFEIFGAKIPGTAGFIGRLIAFILGMLFIVISFFLGFIEFYKPTPSPTQVVFTSTPQNIIPTVAQENTSVSPPNPTSLEPSTPPKNSTCPQLQGASLLSLGIVYGPDNWNGVSYYISFDQDNIYVLDSNSNVPASYPGSAINRNQWLPLTGTPYQICVDSNGNVFGIFSP